MNRKLPIFGLLIAFATIIFSVESMIPMPLPWFRIGFANLVTLLVLKWWGIRYASIVLLLRILIGSMLIGKLFQPAFFLSIAGGGASLVVMALMMRFYPKFIGIIGISVLGAVSHNLAQILFTYLFYVNHIRLFFFIPIFLIAAVFTGCLIGFLVFYIDRRIGIKVITL